MKTSFLFFGALMATLSLTSFVNAFFETAKAATKPQKIDVCLIDAVEGGYVRYYMKRQIWQVSSNEPCFGNTGNEGVQTIKLSKFGYGINKNIFNRANIGSNTKICVQFDICGEKSDRHNRSKTCFAKFTIDFETNEKGEVVANTIGPNQKHREKRCVYNTGVCQASHIWYNRPTPKPHSKSFIFVHSVHDSDKHKKLANHCR